MSRSAIIIILINYCASFFSQDITYTREFDTKRKSVPLQIINNHRDYFYVLRYNKLAHDLTVESRLKPSGEIRSFTPLKLDSVNADWFDYENLEYLFFAQHDQACFVFEKTLNNKKHVYLKTIDSSGKSSGFTELAFLEQDHMVSRFDFTFRLTGNNKILIIGTQDYTNATSKKIALLYDPEKREKIWIKKLPLENLYTGYSQGFETNAANDLFYLLVKSKVEGYKRKFVKNEQISVPVFFYDSLAVVSFLNNEREGFHKKKLAISGLTGLKSCFISTDEKQVVVLSHYTQRDSTDEDSPYFLAQGFRNDLNAETFSMITPLAKDIKKSLTFYDGTDFKSAADKDYELVKVINNRDHLYYLAGRSEENYYKELLLWKVNLQNGSVISQEIVPRKIFYFDDRTRFKNIGLTAQQVCKDNFYSFLLEDADNLSKSTRGFDFHSFARQKYLWGANLIAYTLKADGTFVKKRIHTNGDYDFVPLAYSSDQCDFIFYLNKGKSEKFGLLQLEGL